MAAPYRSLPPLNSLHTFEAVARNLSFTKAGLELSLTQSAVSHQIRALEQHLGTPLFRRLNRSIEVTDAGNSLLNGVKAGLDSILLASERVRGRHRMGVLTVAAPTAFATWWLVPRLGRFAALHPSIEVRIAVVDDDRDLHRSGADVLITSKAPGTRERPGEMRLLREEIFPVCSPELAVQLGSPAALLDQTLIECGACDEAAEAHWDHWIAKLRLRGTSEPRRLHFSHFGTALTAAIDGLGVVLGRSPMVDVELAAGRLVRPFGKKVVAKAPTLFVLHWHDFSDQRVTAFRDFALDEACGCELAAGPCGMPPSEQDSRSQIAWSAGRAARRAVTFAN